MDGIQWVDILIAWPWLATASTVQQHLEAAVNSLHLRQTPAPSSACVVSPLTQSLALTSHIWVFSVNVIP